MIFCSESFIPAELQELIHEFIPVEDLAYLYKKFNNDQWLFRFCSLAHTLSLASMYRIMKDITLPSTIRIRSGNKAMRIEVPNIHNQFNSLRGTHITQSIDDSITDQLNELMKEIIIRDDLSEWHRLTEDIPEISLKDCHTCFRFTLECNAMKIWKYRVYPSISYRYGLSGFHGSYMATKSIPSMLILLDRLQVISHENYCHHRRNRWYLSLQGNGAVTLDHQYVLNMYVTVMIESLQDYSTCYQYIKGSKTELSIITLLQNFRDNAKFNSSREYYVSVCDRYTQSYGLQLFKDVMNAVK
jgi:hypothetical protein